MEPHSVRRSTFSQQSIVRNVFFFLVCFFSQTLGASCCKPFSYACFYAGDGTCHIYYGAQALYWKICQSTLDFAVDFDSKEQRILGVGKTHVMDYGWEIGGRAWVGWNWCGGWDLNLAYTYFANEAKGCVKHQDNSLIPSLLHPASAPKKVDLAQGKLHLEYQTVDLLFGKILSCYNDRVLLHPFFGGRAVKLYQNLNVDYKEKNFFLLPYKLKWRSTLEGAGIHAGMEMQYQWKYGRAFYGSFASSLLSSRSDNTQTQRIHRSFIEEEESSRGIRLKEKQWLCLPGVHLSIGLCFYWWIEECAYFNFKIGYEINHWFNTQQLRRYHDGAVSVSSNNTSGNIALHGATLSFEFVF